MTNLNPQQFSQPTLPGFNLKPTDAHRWPRGYTPERQQEVRESGLRIATVRQTNFNAPAGSPPHGEILRPGAPFTDKAGERRAQDVIARSTTPAPELSGVLVQTGSPLPDGIQGLYHGAGGVRSATVRVGGSSARDPRQIEQRAGHTLLHELGHHRSALAGTKHSEYDTPTKVGKEEAFADDNVTERYHPDPRDVRKRPDKLVAHTSGYPAAFTTKRETDAYRKALKRPTEGSRLYNESRASTRQEQDAQVRMDNYRAGQLLFRRQGREYGDPTPDVGQYPLTDHAGEPIGTIKVKGRPNKAGGQR